MIYEQGTAWCEKTMWDKCTVKVAWWVKTDKTQATNGGEDLDRSKDTSSIVLLWNKADCVARDADSLVALVTKISLPT